MEAGMPGGQVHRNSNQGLISARNSTPHKETALAYAIIVQDHTQHIRHFIRWDNAGIQSLSVWLSIVLCSLISGAFHIGIAAI